MPSYPPLFSWLYQVPTLLFVFAFGGCVGSFINVLAYRLPKGLGVVVPSSRCPKCQTVLGWRENIPILGWLMLRGKCRHCRRPISPEYPIVEFIVALLFALLYAMWAMDPSPLVFLGVPDGWGAPDWTNAGMGRVWPALGLTLLLVGALAAMTIVDAKTFTIPLVIPWSIGLLALATHPLHALWIQTTGAGRLIGSAHEWVIPTGGWEFTLAALGGGAGLVIACALLALRAIPRSFADYEAWEKSVTKPEGGAEGQAPRPAGSMLVRVLLLTGPAIAGMALGATVGMRLGKWAMGMTLGAAIGLVVGVFLRRLAPDDAPSEHEPVWTRYPFVRREMWKELLFVSPIVLLALAGWAWGMRLQGVGEEAVTSAPPLWLAALGGSVMGLLVGGGIVWGVRIVFSIAFKKEAMGLGDVHMMAGVGAALGWIDPLLAFFVAPFSGIALAAAGTVFPRLLKSARVLPYGPHLAVATLTLIYLKPLYEKLLEWILKSPINLP